MIALTVIPVQTGISRKGDLRFRPFGAGARVTISVKCEEIFL